MIKPENIKSNSDLDRLETIDIAKLHSGLNGLNQKIDDFEKLPLWRQGEGAKEIISAMRDSHAAVIFAVHKIFDDLNRIKKSI